LTHPQVQKIFPTPLSFFNEKNYSLIKGLLKLRHVPPKEDHHKMEKEIINKENPLQQYEVQSSNPLTQNSYTDINHFKEKGTFYFGGAYY
jgi:hypothetical protein